MSLGLAPIFLSLGGETDMTATKVLLVDDEAPFLEVMTKRLQARGLQVFSAPSGEEALRRIDENPDLEVAVLDLKMPGMDGLDTLKEIKRRIPLIEVIILTGHATIRSGIEGIKERAFDYLVKPCDIDELMAGIEAAATRKIKHEDQVVSVRSAWPKARKRMSETMDLDVRKALEYDERE
ncbi:MAG: response regulator [Pseudomonadota bacterium]